MDVPEPITRRPPRRKRLTIISVVSIVIGALLTYGVLSYNAWTGLTERSEQAAMSVKASVDESLAVDEASETIGERIERLLTDFDKAYGEEPCGVSPLYQWQTVLPAVQGAVNDCQARVAAAVALTEALEPLGDFLDDEAAAAELIKETVTQTASQKDLAAASAAWKALAASGELSDTDVFQPVKEKIIADSTAIGDAYASLADALKNEDKAGFDLATSQLEAAYRALPDLSGEVDTARDALISKVIEAYEQL
jgi:hypothetical protein